MTSEKTLLSFYINLFKEIREGLEVIQFNRSIMRNRGPINGVVTQLWACELYALLAYEDFVSDSLSGVDYNNVKMKLSGKCFLLRVNKCI